MREAICIIHVLFLPPIRYVRLIPASDNRGAGSTMGHDMSDLPDGTLVELR